MFINMNLKCTDPTFTENTVWYNFFRCHRYCEEADRVFGGRISIDLMFGRPKQTLQSWENELGLVR